MDNLLFFNKIYYFRISQTYYFRIEQKQGNSGSATSVDLGDLPFDMPKLNRRLRGQTGQSTETAPNTLDLNMTNASSSQSMREENRLGNIIKNKPSNPR